MLSCQLFYVFLMNMKKMQRQYQEAFISLSVTIICVLITQKLPSMLLDQKKNGRNSASFGRRHIIHQPIQSSYLCKCYSLDGVSGLSEGELQLIFNYMKVVIQLTKLSYTGGKVLNAAIIVDPISRQVIASANDQTCPWPTTYKTSARYSCNDRCSDVCAGVSCLNPWGWTTQKQSSQSSSMKSESKRTWHPLRHAALVAIENAAERDRQLFPGPGSSESQSTPNGNPLCADNCPAKRQKIQQHVCQLDLFRQEHSLVKEVPDNREPTEIMRPYLCTGFDIYLVWEPCTMCAMALVHQRIRRIFFALPNPNAGALGSVYRLQGEKSLNHHYSVFRILIPEQDLNRVELNVSDNFLLHG
ncbi:tRNA-specific adenosine deaminase TAD3-like isoform X6 [Musa acuminata AAA Group]|uniref:tRNA-specific adenosine deaminase TAD3-like isoform X6 n=1 Tax=Musa acuminata AAA Group TaxID=214697 RepID=UPI0031CF8400